MADTDSTEIRVAHLEALDGMLGYMHRRLKTSDYSDPFVRGYAQAYSDLAHVRAQVWFDWRRVDPEAAEDHKQDWDAVHASEPLGTNRIFPKETIDGSSDN